MKPIFLTEEDKKSMQDEFLARLNKAHLFDGGFSYIRKYTYDVNQYAKARILYTPLAYVKMQALLSGFATEVAWHGMVVRGEDPCDFIVYDIITHKQVVTGSKVDTEDDDYREFLMSLDDETAANLCLQAHSHVNMATTPSGTDLTHQAKIIADKSRKKRGFQIFQIWNKNMKVNSYIYDFDENIYYEDKDVEVEILLDPKSDYLVTDFLSDAHELVKPRVYTYQNTQTQNAASKKEEKPVKKENEQKENEKLTGNKADAPDKNRTKPDKQFSPSEIETMKEAYRRYWNLPKNYDVEQDDEWEDFLYYSAYGINGGVY